MDEYAVSGIFNPHALKCVPCTGVCTSGRRLKLQYARPDTLILDEHGHLRTVLGVIVRGMDSQLVVAPAVSGRPVGSAHAVFFEIGKGVVKNGVPTRVVVGNAVFAHKSALPVFVAPVDKRLYTRDTGLRVGSGIVIAVFILSRGVFVEIAVGGEYQVVGRVVEVAQVVAVIDTVARRDKLVSVDDNRGGHVFFAYCIYRRLSYVEPWHG